MKHQIFTLAIAATTMTATKAFSQTAITSANTTYVQATTGKSYTENGAPSSGYAEDSYHYKYGNQSGTTSNNLQINGFNAGGVNYSYNAVAGAYVKMRRVNNAVVSGVRNLKFEEGTVINNNIKVAGGYNDDMESFFSGNKNFNSGTDNLFGNQGDDNGNNNNIERLDVIFPGGYTPTDNTKAGFALFERGATNAHDGVKLALILTVNATGMPTSYSNIITITSSNYGTTDVVAGKDYIIDRRDNATENFLKISTTTNQPVGGVFFKYSEFGITAGTRVYGYSVIPNDFTGTPADIADYTNAAHYPTNTSSNTGAGGIDLVSVTGMVISSVTLPLTLLSFDATADNRQVVLDWKTADEKDVRTMEIEKSSNSADWNTTGNVTPNGSSYYSFTDDKPAAGINYYRLKFIDLDGSFTYSPTRIVRMDSRQDATITLAPNPATDHTSILLSSVLNNSGTVTVFNAAGQQVQHINATGQQKIDLDLGSYTPGIYYIVVADGSNIIYKGKLVKQ